MSNKRAMAQLLKHLSSIGVTHVPKVELAKRRVSAARGPSAPAAVDSSVTPEQPSGVAGTSRRPTKSAPVTAAIKPMRRVPGMLDAEDLHPSSVRVPELLPEVVRVRERAYQTREAKEEALCGLKSVVAGCQRCSELSSRRTQTVFGVGNANARIMIIGEAPGQDEDEQGEPFVGEAGQLLNKIISASQLRREDLYICNILRCRPPGNRNPLPQEAANCREFLDAQIHVVQPEFIICLGAVAAQNLLGVETPISKMRGQFFSYGSSRVLCTYHPSYLLRNPNAKKQVWEDMKFFMKELGVELQ
jgi:uracil-DNA glycosylase family 4